MRNSVLLLFLGSLLLGCTADETNPGQSGAEETTLADTIDGHEFIISNVIACAGSIQDSAGVRVYLYPRPAVTNIRYFETSNSGVDPNDFENYTERRPPLNDLFNGYLRFFEAISESERWVIITFEEEGVVNLSNPIRLKHLTQPTEFLPENVVFSNDLQPLNPQFTWVDGAFDDTIIYFQVVSTQQNDLLSGTYTLDRNFQFYVLDNVVLNITEEGPPPLELDTPYTFTLLSVTEDNWVNLFSEISFRLE